MREFWIGFGKGGMETLKNFGMGLACLACLAVIAVVLICGLAWCRWVVGAFFVLVFAYWLGRSVRAE